MQMATASSTNTRRPRASMDVEAELSAPSAQVRVVRYGFEEPPESVLRLEDKIRVELCLETRHRSARACFADWWNPSQFQRIGEMFVVPPTLDLIARSDETRPLTSVVCLLELAPVLALFEQLPEFTNQWLFTSLDIRDPNIKNMLLRLAFEARNPGFASPILVEAIATQISIDLLRYGAVLPERPLHRGLVPWQLSRVDERLREVREAPTLQELAALCRVSVRQLTRAFRAVRGCSVGAYVANSQIGHAKALLDAGESVAAIAVMLGFSSSSNFCSAFRRATGMTPGQYRQTLPRH